VFEDSYQLMDLSELNNYIKKNQQLPGIDCVDSVDITGRQAKQLEKIEELTLYTLQQQEQIEELNQRILVLENTK